MSDYLVDECIDTFDIIMAIRSLATGAPQVSKPVKTTVTNNLNGISIAGTGNGQLYVRPKFGGAIDTYTLTCTSAGGDSTRNISPIVNMTITAAGRTIDNDDNLDWTVLMPGLAAGGFITIQSPSRLNNQNGKTFQIQSIVNNAATNDRIILETIETVVDEAGIVGGVIGHWTPGAIFNVRRDPGGVNEDLGNLIAGRGANFEDTNNVRLTIRTIADWVVNDTLTFTLVANDLIAQSQNWTDNLILADPVTAELIQNLEIYLEGPGISGVEAINVNFQAESNFGLDRYNIDLWGADGFIGSSTFGSQPNISPGDAFFAGSRNPMPLWLTVSGDRILFMFRAAGGVFEHGYGGFGDVLANQNQHPRPMIVGGSSDVSSTTPGDTNVRHTAWWDPASSTTTTTGSFTSSCVHRWVDGQWLHVANKTNSAARTTASDLFWTPWKQNIGKVGSTGPTGSAENEFFDHTVPAPGDQYIMLPITLLMDLPDENVILDAQGVFFITGFGLNPEDTITIGADEYIIGNNVNLTGQGDFVAIRLTGP